MRRLGAAALLMTSAVFLSRVIGYFREAFVAARFGASHATDAFYAAFTIPDWLNYLVAGGTLSITFLPIYARYLAAGDEREGNRVLSIVLTAVLAVVGVGVLCGEIWAEPILSRYFHRLPPDALAPCVRYTRILLPAQLCFVAGGVLAATLLARGRFAAAALAPLLYNVGIIAGGALLGDRLGAEALAWGALAGAFAGPFLVPAIGAWRAGARVRLSFAVGHPAFVEWLKLSLPLMIGVSLVTADEWILRYFAGDAPGEITRLNNAKRLVAVPIAMAGQAIGQASMPFFALLFAQGRREELAETFARTARGAGVVALLLGAWMAALSLPLTDLLFRRGLYMPEDSVATAAYLAIFAAAVPLWALQGIVSRLFYAARNTLTPMLAGTAVTLASLPLYALAHRAAGATGLAAASGVGILLHTLAIGGLAPRVLPELRRRSDFLAGLLRGALLAALAGAAAHGTTWALGNAAGPLTHATDLVLCAAGTAIFAAVVLVGARPLGVPEPELVLRRVLAKLRLQSR